VKPLAKVCGLAVLQTVFLAPYVMLVRYLFDRGIPSGEWRTMLLAGAGMVALHLINAAMMLKVRVLALDATKLVIAEVRCELVQKVYALSRSYLTTQERSRLHSRIVMDSERVDIMSNALAAHVLPALSGALTMAAILLWLNWKLFLGMALFVPLGRLLTVPLGKRLKARSKAFREAFEEFSRGVNFVLNSVDLARMQHAEKSEIERQGRAIDDLRRKSRNMAWLDTAYSLSQGTVTTTSSIAVLVLGGAWVAAGGMSMGGLLSFYVCAGMLNAHVRTLTTERPRIVAGQESLEAVDAILRTEETEPYRGTRRIEFQGGIEFRGVTFGYGQRAVLRDFQLSAGPHERIALIGANGSGKTTALHLLCGFYRPERGELCADGVEYDELDMRELRRSIAVVMQDPILFSGTIHENIAYGDGGATREDVRTAARKATADAFIEELPLGYETPVGDGGVLLSGGQRQKISIARALIGRPKLLVLDEPTNHLDAASVRRLMRNIAATPDSPTTILVSHDLEVAGAAERVYELRDGRLAPREDLGRRKAADAAHGGGA
jgi:ABC-type bacteriocin/lantibiotic exporter with double-glycine peptidase domain